MPIYLLHRHRRFHISAALCDPKLTVAIPLPGGFSYDHMKNVVHVIPLNGTLSHTGSRAHIEGLQDAWIQFFRSFENDYN